jgi:hypothetical protein
MPEQNETQRLVRDAISKAARELYEKSKAIPAPCGCTPKARCDAHCRVKIRRAYDDGGYRGWFAKCNGTSEVMFCTAGSASLWELHDWATEHVTKHRQSRFRGARDAD